ncbi:MAG: hypothetical protein Q9157_006779 [Trypethelium eluteriae]
MGGRLSTPRGPEAAFTMAGLLFVYARTSIRAAKLNAQRHREADGGQISWHNENLRRHGQLKRPEQGSIKDLFWNAHEELQKAKEEPKSGRSEDEQKLRVRMGKTDDGDVKKG